ncbi:cupin domain-containing protein [uncultured Shewanella sp.]|uniref:cupin domain-containing protein n=1 Tax=uncultured Shewanella sp. TaxID=173975 RepID=UPI002613FD51|nr:cupin domain-containing protein [uncultured Shewanella sp.]
MKISMTPFLIIFYFFCSTYAYAHDVHGKQQGIAVDVITKSDTSWDGTLLPHYATGQPEITILKITVQPGATLPIHEHPYINAGILMTGELTVVRKDNGKTLHLKAGDSITELVNTWHYGKNEGKVPAEIIVFYAGIKGKPITIIEKGQKK